MPLMTDDAYVRLTQTGMKSAGAYKGGVDGDPGPMTVAAFKSLLNPGGRIEGDPIIIPPILRVKGAAKPIDDIDLPRLGAEIGVGEDEIHAVIDVEARGKGFDSQGRVIMLFEPHVFFRELRHDPYLQGRAMEAGLAYPEWRKGNYPADSYPRFWEAYALHPEAAMRSASWGFGQIMGFNAHLTRYGSPQKMIEAFADDTEAHLAAMVDFIIAADLADDLRAHRWKTFAKGYNGASYAANGYHTKLARSFAKWAKIRDTPLTA